MKKLNTILILLIASLLHTFAQVGFATSKTSNGYFFSVNAFGLYSMAGQSFFVVPNEETLADDPEFKIYANYVFSALCMQGAVEATDLGSAKIRVVLEYGVEETYPTVANTLGSSYRIGNVTLGGGSTIVERAFKHILKLSAFENETNSYIWKLSAEYTSSNSQLQDIMPIMVYAVKDMIGKQTSLSNSIYIDKKECSNMLYRWYLNGICRSPNTYMYPATYFDLSNKKTKQLSIVGVQFLDDVTRVLYKNEAFYSIKIPKSIHVESPDGTYSAAKNTQNVVLDHYITPEIDYFTIDFVAFPICSEFKIVDSSEKPTLWGHVYLINN